MLIEHMSKGLSFESFGAVINVDRDTVFEWVKVHKDFSDAKRIAFDNCLLFWEEMGIRGSFHRDFKPASWIYNMKCRFRKQGWNDQQTLEVQEKSDATKRKYVFMEPVSDTESDDDSEE